MHEFRWMAPIQVGFSSAPGAMDRDPDAYRSFWDDVAKQVRRPNWTIHRATRPEVPLGWSKATADTLPRSLAVVSGTLDHTIIPEQFDLEVAELRWSLHDHQVLLVEGRFRSADTTAPARLQDADHWENAVQAFGEVLAKKCADTEYGHLARVLTGMDEAAGFVQLEDLAIGRPLWVTRSLALDPEDSYSRTLARDWVSGIDDAHRLVVEEVIDGERPLVAQWMNHVFRTDRPDETDQSWSALQKAQFFWAAMQWIDDSLRLILAWSMADRAEVSVSDLRRELRATINQAQELIMLRAEVRQHVSRGTHVEMQRFLEFWEFDELLEEPVNQKVEICKERLTALAEDRAARSAMFTDIILMGIGVTSVLATAIALVQFGRDASQDPSQSIFDFGNGSITSWLSSQSMDAILIMSLLLSIVLVAIFIWKRRQSIS